ncbi:globin-coupled sensor protein [Microvirga splendida]|uniref:globin-coupled sensor protein n=1 Tax=Microvirga splendida TaxID=2795727 RepID=UPI001FEFC1C6|nr:globin-coupled sensor protein [Microvirga splendida]
MHNDSAIADRLNFAGIDDGVRKELRKVWQDIHPVLPKILEAFYVHMHRQPQLSQMIGTQQSRLVSAQLQHWARLFSGNFDAAYVEGIRRIGLIHNKIGLEPRWYIGGYAFVLNELVVALSKKHRFNGPLLARRLTVINRAVMLDMDLAISVYQDAFVQERQKKGEILSQAVASFSSAVQESLQISGQASGALSESAAALDAATTNASSLATQVTGAAEQTASNMQSGAAATEQLASSVREIGQQASRSADVARHALQSSRRTKDTVTGLAEQAREIGDVVDLIERIAAQTNLLALNATIEAARAGEMGKGFAVVAQEVKTLANQTAKATTEIGTRIGAIQEATRQSVTDIDDIGRIMDDLSGIATAIAAAVEEQAAVTSEIAVNVSQTTDHTHAVVRSIEALTGSTASAASAAHQVSDAKQTLDQQLQRLKQDIDHFLAKAQAA